MRRLKAVFVAGIVLAASLPSAAQVSKPATIWNSSPNYTASSRETTYDIDSIVIHTTEGTYSGAISWFKTTSSGVSAHYVISPTGEITQMVADDDIAWHATYYNNRAIGIECAGYAGKASTWTPALLDSLKKLVAYLADRYDVPVVHPATDAYAEPDDRFKKTGLLSHGQIQPWNRTDPGPFFPWVTFVADVAALLSPASPPAAPEDLSPDGGMPASSPASLSWSPLADLGVDMYHVEIDRWTGTSWTFFDEKFPTSASAPVTFTLEGPYRFAVWAHNSAGWGPGSAYASFYGLPPPPVPAAPTGLTPAGSVSKWGPSVTLKWSPVAGADKYEVYLQYMSGGSYRYYYAWDSTSASKAVWPSVKYTWYRWWVRAHNSSGWGPYSGGGSPTSGSGAAKFYFNK